MKKIAVISVLIMGIILLSGCTGLKSENTIIGKWQEDDGSIIEFFEDGTMNLVYETSSESVEYEFVDDNNIRVTTSDGTTGVIGVSISRNKLIMDYRGSVAEFKRIDATKDATNTWELSTKNIKIQNKLETPEGYIVKIEIIEDASRTDMIQIEGLLENPTNNLLKSTQFEVGILYKYVDEYSLDKNSEWSILRSGVKYPGDVEPRHSAPLELRSFPISTLEIKPYMIVYGNVVGGNVYPPCFTDDPRNQCYDTKYVAGEGYINVPKY